MSGLPLPAQTFGLLALSKVFMTIAWYGIALFEYLLQVPANRIDYLWAALCLVGAVYFIFRA